MAAYNAHHSSFLERLWHGSLNECAGAAWPVLAQASSAASRPAAPLDGLHATRWWHSVGWSAVILVAFVFAMGAIIVFSRRFREYLTRGPNKPTDCVDVWQMHKTPDQAGDDGIEPDDDGSTSPPR